jgi:hypothetical protein
LRAKADANPCLFPGRNFSDEPQLTLLASLSCLSDSECTAWSYAQVDLRYA